MSVITESDIVVNDVEAPEVVLEDAEYKKMSEPPRNLDLDYESKEEMTKAFVDEIREDFIKALFNFINKFTINYVEFKSDKLQQKINSSNYFQLLIKNYGVRYAQILPIPLQMFIITVLKMTMDMEIISKPVENVDYIIEPVD